MQKYSVNHWKIEILLALIKSGEIAIPEIQRPFVWDSTKVRDLIDSLYQGTRLATCNRKSTSSSATNPPKDYIKLVIEQMKGHDDPICGIKSKKALRENFQMHCVPPGFEDMTINDYGEFLAQRRVLLAHKIRDYYFSL